MPAVKKANRKATIRTELDFNNFSIPPDNNIAKAKEIINPAKSKSIFSFLVKDIINKKQNHI